MWMEVEKEIEELRSENVRLKARVDNHDEILKAVNEWLKRLTVVGEANTRALEEISKLLGIGVKYTSRPLN